MLAPILVSGMVILGLGLFHTYIVSDIFSMTLTEVMRA